MFKFYFNRKQLSLTIINNKGADQKFFILRPTERVSKNKEEWIFRKWTKYLEKAKKEIRKLKLNIKFCLF